MPDTVHRHRVVRPCRAGPSMGRAGALRRQRRRPVVLDAGSPSSHETYWAALLCEVSDSGDPVPTFRSLPPKRVSPGRQRTTESRPPTQKGSAPLLVNAPDLAAHESHCAATPFDDVGSGSSAVDLPIFSRPGPMFATHEVIGSKQLLGFHRLTRASTNREERAEFRADLRALRDVAQSIQVIAPVDMSRARQAI